MDFRTDRGKSLARGSVSIPGSSTNKCWSIAGFDSRDSCGGVGSAKQGEIHRAGGK